MHCMLPTFMANAFGNIQLNDDRKIAHHNQMAIGIDAMANRSILVSPIYQIL